MSTPLDLARKYGPTFTRVSGCPGCTLDYGACPLHNPGALRELACMLIDDLQHAGHLTHARAAHTRAAGKQAANLIQSTGWEISPLTMDLWVATTTLHDVGYAAPDTDHHAIDGGRLLAAGGFPPEVVTQVAWHSTAWWDALERGMNVDALSVELGRIQHGSMFHSVVWLADLTTSPDGGRTTVKDRVAEIRARYPANSEVIRALDRAAPHMSRAQNWFRKRTTG